MNPLELLEQRVSIPVLAEPAPTPAELEHVWKAALRAPDHAQLRPWRFLTVTGEAREALGELFIKAAAADNPQLSEDEARRIGSLPLRAPMLIVVVARLREHPKVPASEQLLSAGCAALNIELALRAQGFGSIWRTGAPAYQSLVKQGLGLGPEEEIVAFLYVGTPAGKVKPVPDLAPADFVQSWQG